MWRSGIAALIVVIGVALCPHSAGAQAGLAPPGPEPSMQAFRAVEAWVRAWGVAPIPPQDLDPERLSGVAVTLRLDGVRLGRGVVLADAGDVERDFVHTATSRAIREADLELPLPFGPERVTEARRLAERITVELELGGPVIPLLGDTFEVASLDVAPQHDGVAIRSGRRLAATFPSEQRSRNIGPGRALGVAIGKLDLPPIELGALREARGVTPYRFRVTHIAQTSPGGPAVFLHRGGTVVAAPEVSVERLREAADEIVDHLLTRRWPGEERHGLFGTHQIATGLHEPLIAEPREQAVTAYALARYAGSASWVEDQRGAAVLIEARRILEDLAVVEPEESDPAADVSAAAAWIVAAGEAGLLGTTSDGEVSDFAERCERLVTDVGLSIDEWPSDVPRDGRALVALARAELARASPGDADRLDRARDGVRTVFREIEPGALAGAMPWLGLAELAVADPGAPIPSFVAMLRMRELMWRFQITEAEAGFDDRDLVGGIVFTRGRSVLPSAQGLRPLAFVAVMLGDERLTEPQSYTSELAALSRALRFVVQLQAREAELHHARHRNRAAGGIRLSPWSQTLPLEASALGLLTITETLKSAESRGRPRPVPVGRE
ncbi:MAG: hypothetical protein AAGI30_13075 [Planctomycetota bacterium]